MPEQMIAGFGFNTHGKPDLSDLADRLDLIQRTGATHAELSLCDLDLIAGGQIIAERRRKLERICAGRPLTYTVHGVLGVNFMDEARLELHESVCRAMLELASVVGAKVMVHHAGKAPAARAHQVEHLHGVERACLRRMGDIAARYGIKIAVENLYIEAAGEYTANPARLAQELIEIDHPHVCGTLDLSHAYLMTRHIGQDFEEALRTFAPLVNHLHLHDSFGRLEQIDYLHSRAEHMAFGRGDLHLPLGWGDIPWQSLASELVVRPRTAMIMEIPPRYDDAFESSAAVARELMDMMNHAGTRDAA